MKRTKSKNITIQQPVIIIGLIALIFASLWCLMMLLPKAEEEVTGLVGINDVRSGEQMISVSVVPPGTDVGADGAVDGITASTADGAADVSANGISKTNLNNAASGRQLITASLTGPAAAGLFTSPIPAEERVKFRIDRFQKLAVQPLKFEIFDENGRALDPENLKSVNGQKVHFYLVHSNLKEFHHLFPEYKNNVWNVSVSMPTPGTYHAYVAVADLFGSVHVFRSDLIVREESATDIARPDPTPGLEFYDGARTAKMTMERMESGRVFALETTGNGELLNPEAYGETTGRLTIFRHDSPEVFVSVPASMVKEAAPVPLFFNSPALTPGRYTAFAEVKLEGKLYTFPFTFDVGTL